jgi:hypothetical protein
MLDWLQAKVSGHLTRINDILTNLMDAERRAGSGRWADFTAFAVGIYCNPRSQERDLGHLTIRPFANPIRPSIRPPNV